MILKINGEIEEITDEEISISRLLQLKKIELLETVSVQLNGDFVKGENFAKQYLKDKDEVDFMYFMGGGK